MTVKPSFFNLFIIIGNHIHITELSEQRYKIPQNIQQF